MKFSDNATFHKQGLQVMETGVYMFQAGGSRLLSPR